MKKILYILLCLILFLNIPTFLKAQNDIQLSQQFLSRINHNPAATGASNYINIDLLSRQQWIGFKDAPSTQVLNVHNFFENFNSGLGLSLINDRLGFEKSVNIKLAYAYHIRFKDSESYLSLGLSGGILHKKLDVDKLITENPNDPTLGTYYGNNTKLNPDFDFGIEFNTKRWQIGLSATHITMLGKQDNQSYLQASNHFYAYTKYAFDLNKDWKFVPGVSVNNMRNTFSLEANTMFYYKTRLWGGISYRSNEYVKSESIVGILGFAITDNIRLGYSYDYNLGALNKYTGGSHEIMLSIRLKKDDYNKNKLLRFYEY